jgi:RNA polymerase sigma-70 factor (ECF subfamily)
MVPAPHTTEALVEGREELAAILAGVQQLPDDRREALIMRFALGMDNREIARALGRSDGATKVLLHRAIRQLEGLVSDAPEKPEVDA